MRKLLENIEKNIERHEEEKEEILRRYNKAGKINDMGLLMELQVELDKIEDKIVEIMIEWEETELELNELEN